MDQSILLLPIEWRPESLVGHHIPGLGTILTLLTIVVTGLLAQNFIGSYILGRWEALLKRIPIVNSIYSSVKQVSDTLFSSDGNAFRTAVLVQYPRPGAWTIAFVTGTPSNAVRQHLEGDFVSIYVPTTPNPTSGFFIMVPRTDIIELTMTVDVALKHIVSMGVVAPELHP
jgi:uncharacterized membrane protein